MKQRYLDHYKTHLSIWNPRIKYATERNFPDLLKQMREAHHLEYERDVPCRIMEVFVYPNEDERDAFVVYIFDLFLKRTTEENRQAYVNLIPSLYQKETLSPPNPP